MWCAQKCTVFRGRCVPTEARGLHVFQIAVSGSVVIGSDGLTLLVY